MLDLKKERNVHIDRRLRSELIIWFTTVRPDGRPHTIPVWFQWDGSSILIFSQPDTVKVRNLRTNPNVTLALDGSDEGGDVVIIEGKAEVLTQSSSDVEAPAYFAKYAASIPGIGLTPEGMAKRYSQPIRITPAKFVGVAG